MKREALAHLTKRVYRQIYTYITRHTRTHMRMGFRPLVNLSGPLSGNMNSIFSTTARSFVNPFLNQSSFPIDNNHLQQQQQQHKDDDQVDDDSNDADLKVELENKQLWDAFHTHGTEMVKTNFFIFRLALYHLFIIGDH